MRVLISSVLVDDQEKALTFYTELLGFVKKQDIPLGEHRWLTLVAPEDLDGHELLLEPDAHPAAKAFKEAMLEDGIPGRAFACDDVQKVYDRLIAAGVTFTQPPILMGPAMTAVFDDTCGNLIQIASLVAVPDSGER